MSARGVLRQRLVALARRGDLAPAGLELALVRLGLLPDAARWRHFADRALFAAGGLLVLAGVVFFFAFNWSGLHRFVRIALVAGPLLASAAVALYALRRRVADGWHLAQGALTVGVVLVGVLLAVIGQIYQTGADSELLFAGWALLALPWVLVAAAPWLWLFWLLLLNVALCLYLAGRADLWAVFSLRGTMLWLPLALNAGALALWEVLALRCNVTRPAYALRLIAFFAALAASALALAWIFMDHGDAWLALRWAPLPYALWALTSSVYYRCVRRDLVPLTLLAASLVAVASAWLGHWLFMVARMRMDGFLFLGLAIAVLSAAATLWLRRTAQSWAGVEKTEADA